MEWESDAVGDEETTWQSRRERVRKAYLDLLGRGKATEDETPTTPPTPGAAPSLDATPKGRSVSSAVLDSLSIGTSATATVSSEMSSAPPASTMPAPSTLPISSESMVWTVSPLGWIDSNLKPSIVAPNGSLVPGLSLYAQSYLRTLAIGRAEPIEAVVRQIAEFFVEAEDERAEGPLGEAIEFYARNYA